MKHVHGWFFPHHETHLPDWLAKNGVEQGGRLAYQWKKMMEAMQYVNNREENRTAVDVGAHVGLWSHYLAQWFDTVHAFEPIAEHRACFEMNTLNQENIILHPCALGCPENEGFVTMHTSNGSSGDSWVKSTKDGIIPLRRLDDFPIENVDFIKLDCEGYELFALQGGQEMLLRNKPVVIVEQKPGRAQKFGLKETEAVEYLQSLGATLKKEMSGDYILKWE